MGSGSDEGKLLPGAVSPAQSRGGPKKAIVAVQHAMMVAIWHMFSRGTMHEDLGPDHFQGRDKKRRLRYLAGQLRNLGVDIPLEAAT